MRAWFFKDAPAFTYLMGTISTNANTYQEAVNLVTTFSPVKPSSESAAYDALALLHLGALNAEITTLFWKTDALALSVYSQRERKNFRTVFVLFRRETEKTTTSAEGRTTPSPTPSFASYEQCLKGLIDLIEGRHGKL